MPSPFPGMDPYLESPAQWDCFQPIFITLLLSALNVAIPEELVGRVRKRVYFVGREEMREAYIEIVPARQQGRIITTIELLSPANKESRRGREEYLSKQEQLIHSDTHLIEIDLLREGLHTVAASQIDVNRRHGGPWDYLVCLHRAGAGYQYEIWPRMMRDALPRIHLPLTEGVADIPLDLQSAFKQAYDIGAFGRVINYSTNPTPPLAESDAAWAETLLRAAGVRR